MKRVGCAALIAVVLLALLAWAVGIVRFLPAGTMDRFGSATAPVAPPQPIVAVRVRSGLIVPVAGVQPRALSDTWGDPREGGVRSHQALDIIAPQGTPVLAAMAGRVEKLFESSRGGTTAYVRSLDGRWMTYYAHLSGYAAGLAEGQVVRAGQPIAMVGDTGDAGPGNFHLHFALHHMAPGERWYQGTPIDPYPLLAGKVVAR